MILTLAEIISVCVVGIDDNEPAATIVRTSNSTINDKHIFNLICEKFSNSKKLRGGIYFIDKMPTTPSGKIARRKVKIQLNELFRANNDK